VALHHCPARSLQIYNEVVRDLSSPEDRALDIREHAGRGVYVEGLKEVELDAGEGCGCRVNPLGPGLLHAGADASQLACGDALCFSRGSVMQRKRKEAFWHYDPLH
jgi:hypothetical protein